MEDKKGLVRHVVEGRTFIYIPKKPADRTIRELTKRFVDRVFDGAIDRMMVALLDSKPPDAAEFDRLRAMIDEAQRQSDVRWRRSGRGDGMNPRGAALPHLDRPRSPSDARPRGSIGAALLDASLAAIAISGMVVLVMVQCRQPARRRAWARAGLLSTLALLPLSALSPVPRVRPLAPAPLGPAFDPR